MPAPCGNREEEKQWPPLEGCEYEKKSGEGVEGEDEAM